MLFLIKKNDQRALEYVRCVIKDALASEMRPTDCLENEANFLRESYEVPGYLEVSPPNAARVIRRAHSRLERNGHKYGVRSVKGFFLCPLCGHKGKTLYDCPSHPDEKGELKFEVS